jgi:hypothetical protein
MLQTLEKDYAARWLEADALLTQAKRCLKGGNEQYRRAREAIVAAQKLDPKLTNRKIAKRLGRSHRWVNGLLKWSGTEGSTPFEKVAKADRADGAGPINSDSIDNTVLLAYDIIEMDEHLLVVGSAEVALAKELILKHAGLPYRREFYHPDAAGEEGDGDGEMNVVVVTDPPYGIGKKKVTNDHRANWGSVYRMFQPRGGFAFCAFQPGKFRDAEDGIIHAGGVPIHYLALNTGWGQPLKHRLHNWLQAIIFFARNDDDPWLEGRREVQLLTSVRTREAVEDRKKLAGGRPEEDGHPTPKPIDVLIRLIELVTDPGDIVLDPFTGCGSTLIACERHPKGRRRFFGVELEPKWAERAARNWMAETGKDAFVRRKGVRGRISLTELIEGPAARAFENAYLASKKQRAA